MAPHSGFSPPPQIARKVDDAAGAAASAHPSHHCDLEDYYCLIAHYISVQRGNRSAPAFSSSFERHRSYFKRPYSHLASLQFEVARDRRASQVGELNLQIVRKQQDIWLAVVHYRHFPVHS
jgi:hypothetical protein